MKTLVQEFHVARTARDRYQFDETMYATSGEIIFANFHAARVFAQKMNQRRDIVNFPEQAVRASQIHALGLIHEVSHHLIRWYRTSKQPTLLGDMLNAMNAQFGTEATNATLRRFAEDFPPLTVYKREQTVEEYMAGETEGISHKELLVEELLLLWLSNINPAFTPFQELFDDADLERETAYVPIANYFPSFFDAQPKLGPGESVGMNDDQAAALARGSSIGQTLLDLLLAPMRAHPHSLEGQLGYMRQQWGAVLGRLIYRVLGGLDMIHEEEKPQFFGGFSSASLPIPRFDQSEPDVENFTLDREWMPQLVMIAKNAYVWLDQLTKQYGRPIRTLADIPDEVLDQYQRWGITGLWLIGLWERSTASKQIKQMMGNEDAVASAYSLYDYQIAYALGGEAACQNLRERAWARGIRLASDMVPNHVGIDGRWLVERPDYFVQADFPPFPSYTFNGPNLSHDGRVGIYLEDHYYSKSDAAVVFKRVDHSNGHESYVYHGNDGTSMAWNDTAQLNYLNPEVREAVIQTILHVARQFPIIRFDAAMTLAKKHFQRLWFPEPGTGGDIASRADFAMTRDEFDRLMPQEFWREVVDRAAVEAPDTLLLAEAFWLMESYFVRTLGMHRVYNSAYMHLLRDEENAKYRMLMKNTLEFDPEILKRYVNFMNNPDEKTAVEQFGKGDKYFGVLTVMVTMPGLPMLGHGQIEGYAEKYGMEYQRAYWNEQIDPWLVARHEREIFPLMHKRYLFANVDHFLLYDFYAGDGVNEHVYAFSNRQGDERGLVVYNNAYANTAGWIRVSAAYMARDGESRRLMQKTLGEGLGLNGGDDWYTIFRDHNAGLEYIRSSRELVEKGLYIELGGYSYHVFLDFRQVQDDASNSYGALASYLNGRGVPSVEDAIRETFLRPIHQPLRALLNTELFQQLTDSVISPVEDEEAEAVDAESEIEALESIGGDLDEAAVAEDAFLNNGALVGGAEYTDEVDELPGLADDLDDGTALDTGIDPELRERIHERLLTLYGEVLAFTDSSGDAEATADDVLAKLDAIVRLETKQQQRSGTGAGWKENAPIVWSWLFLHSLGKLSDEKDFAQQSVSWIDEWLIGRMLSDVFQSLGRDEMQATNAVLLVKRLVAYQNWFDLADTDAGVLEALLADTGVQQLIGVNRYQGVLWFSKEHFDELLGWMQFLAAVAAEVAPRAEAEELLGTIGTISTLQKAAGKSDYQLAKLLQLARS